MFKRDKNKKNEVKLSVFGEPISEEKPVDKSSFKSYVVDGWRSFGQKFSGLMPQSKIQIKYLLKFKRGLAGLLCIMYLFTFAAVFPDLISILFILTFFILLDYCWKTRIVKWVKDD